MTQKATAVPSEKRCARCKITKHAGAFSLRRGRNVLESTCNKCKAALNTARSRARREANPEHYRRQQREIDLKRYYGMTGADYERLLDAQHHRCAICRAEEPGGNHTRFSVDHDHASNEVRGLLCNNCNRALGMLKDNAATLKAAVAYLERPRTLFDKEITRAR